MEQLIKFFCCRNQNEQCDNLNQSDQTDEGKKPMIEIVFKKPQDSILIKEEEEKESLQEPQLVDTRYISDFEKVANLKFVSK